ncbi:MAG: serine acetyltransferase [Flavobacteriaceae bacterium]|nr:serine acetyltransferase [Flavobacteriaceae bacterium]
MSHNRLKTIKELRQFLRYDRIAQGGGNFYRKFLASPVFRFTVLLRINEYLVNNSIPMLLRIIPYFWYRRISVRLGFSIPFNVFDYGLGIVHYGLLIVNPDTRVGSNCRIHAGVNIGGSAGFRKPGDTARYAPTIGSNCYIGPGAKLFGPITIGDNSVIGANAVVNKSFEGNCTIGGVPAKVLSDKNSEGMVYKLK